MIKDSIQRPTGNAGRRPAGWASSKTKEALNRWLLIFPGITPLDQAGQRPALPVISFFLPFSIEPIEQTSL